MALTPEDVKKLTAPFALEDHEFNPRGYVYISEEAISARLDEVDPSWEFVVTNMVRDLTSATVTGRLTVGGVTREGVGTQGIEYVKGNDQAAKTDAVGSPIEAGEVRKGAATDAFKRAARLFGIGRYLLGAPKQSDFKTWLAKLAKGDSPAAPTEPTVNGWTTAQAGSLVTEARNNGITNDELLQMLRVSRISEYEPGFSAARDNLRKFIAAKRQTANSEPVVL
jgi:hypothetical protein